MTYRILWIILLIVGILSIAPGATNAAKVVAIAAGDSHVLALNDDGTVLSWGMNSYGELGTGVEGNSTVQQHFMPQQVLINNVTAIAAGNMISYALKSDGTVWAWGYGVDGELGYGGNESQCVPVQVKGMTDVVAIAAGRGVGLALKKDGTVWAWGENHDGGVGDGTTTDRLTPVQVRGLSDIVALGERGDYAIRKDGAVFAWGDNRYLVDPSTGTTYGALGDTSGPGIRPTPFQVQGLSNVTMITSGYDQTIYAKDDGTVWAWGSIYYGNLGDGEIKVSRPIVYKPPSVKVKITNVTKISSIADHCVALKDDGTVWAWGQYIDERFAGPNGEYGDPVPVEIKGLDHVIDVSTGIYTGIALEADGSIWGWGQNYHGQLGNNKENDPKPVMILAGPAQATPTPLGQNSTSPAGSTSPDTTDQKGTSGLPIPGMSLAMASAAMALVIVAHAIVSACNREK